MKRKRRMQKVNERAKNKRALAGGNGRRARPGGGVRAQMQIAKRTHIISHSLSTLTWNRVGA